MYSPLEYKAYIKRSLLLYYWDQFRLFFLEVILLLYIRLYIILNQLRTELLLVIEEIVIMLYNNILQQFHNCCSDFHKKFLRILPWRLLLNFLRNLKNSTRNA